MNMQTATPPRASGPDLAAVKQRQQAPGPAGHAVVGTTLQIVGETLAEAADVRGGERVLDVAAGNGNASLAAARRFADVTSTDYVPGLLDKAAARAQAEGLAMTFQVADVEELPFADRSFDVVLSTFGAMFAPDHQRTAHEMLRVLRPGGRLGMANWTPESFIGQLFKLIGRHVPPPAGLQPPAAWGTEAHCTALFGVARRDALRAAPIHFRYRSPRTSCRCSATTTARRKGLRGSRPPAEGARGRARPARRLTPGRKLALIPSEYLGSHRHQR
jgi:SAM-dependent methyltransferase